jgi:hypothetical protein
MPNETENPLDIKHDGPYAMGLSDGERSRLIQSVAGDWQQLLRPLAGFGEFFSSTDIRTLHATYGFRKVLHDALSRLYGKLACLLSNFAVDFTLGLSISPYGILYGLVILCVHG